MKDNHRGSSKYYPQLTGKHKEETMKQSFRTAKNIYDELFKAKAELDEIGEACSSVRDKLSESHIGYTLLKKQYDEKLQELRKLETAKFVPEGQTFGREIPIFGEIPRSSDPEQYHHK